MSEFNPVETLGPVFIANADPMDTDNITVERAYSARPHGARAYLYTEGTWINKQQIDDLITALLYFRDHELEEGET